MNNIQKIIVVIVHFAFLSSQHVTLQASLRSLHFLLDCGWLSNENLNVEYEKLC